MNACKSRLHSISDTELYAVKWLLVLQGTAQTANIQNEMWSAVHKLFVSNFMAVKN